MSHGYTGAGSDDRESIRTIHRAVGLGVNRLPSGQQVRLCDGLAASRDLSAG